MPVCFFCGGQEIIEKNVDYVKFVNGIKVVVPGIPVEECQKCGEQTIHDSDYAIVEAEAKKYLDMTYALDNRIEEVRKARDLTLESVALRLGTTRQRLNDIEKGKNDPSIKFVLMLSQVLEVPVEDLYCLKVVSKESVKKR